MRVLLNGLAALKPKTGVGHHVADLFAALSAAGEADQFTLYPGELLGKAARALRSAKRPAPPPQGVAPPGGQSSPVRDWLKRAAKSAAVTASRFHFAGFTRAFRFDLYHEPNFVPFPSRLPTVITVHDLSVLKYPQWHPADRVKQHQKHFLRGLGKAEHVIVVSEAVRNELIDELNCPPHRVTAVYNGVSPQYVPQPAEEVARVRHLYGLPEKFFLCVGTIEPRKNLTTAMRAFVGLPAAVREGCPLVLVGPWGWRSEAEREVYETAGRAAGVRHIGYVPAADLPAVYAAARVLLYPSHYEGFGLPPVEMLACGGAVLASTADAVREVLAGHAWFVDADDTGGWKDALHRAATDDEFVDRLRTNGPKQAGRYTWARAAEETRRVYATVLGVAVPVSERKAA
jgi:glycosyltransferase involved in cell wall biosynthesis